MKKKFSYGLAVLLFFLFFIYILFCERTNIYQTRKHNSNSQVASVSVEETLDSDTPLGFKTTYRFQIASFEQTENCLAFYLVHQFTEVYFDDELVYSISPDSESRIGKSPCCNWVIIPLFQEDVGSNVRVEVIPVYEHVSNREIDITIGCHYDIFMDCLAKDFPEFVLASMCVALGICILGAHYANRKYKHWNILYLGMMSLLIGIWKITDLPLAPMVFPSMGKGFGYIALGSLLLLGTTILLYAKQIFLKTKTTLLNYIISFNYIMVLSVLLLQIFNIYDLRELLFLTHIGLAIIVATIIYTAATNLEHIKGSTHPGLYRFFMFALVLSLIVDMILYYTTKDGLNMICSQLMFFSYCAGAFIIHVLQTTRKIYTDTMTGLFNKAKWNEAVSESLVTSNTIAVIMLDLNTLKEINDLYGHDVGDQLIYNFATVLKKTLPSDSLICRWGGDEFAVMLNEASHEYVSHVLATLQIAVDRHNQTEEFAKISYATGYAISSDHKNLNAEDLFKKADENMYIMKQEWHRTHK